MLECVPNFSEGQDQRAIQAIVDAISSAAGVTVLGCESDADHNRTVVTLAGETQPIVEGAVRGAACAAEVIDLTKHRGVHPRLGATDVIPFIPLGGASMETAIEAAHEAGSELWRRTHIPVYFYERAALSADRQALQDVRRRGFEQLQGDFATHLPDLGDVLHPTAGATLIGARDFLIALNVILDTADIAVAQEIAWSIRGSSGGFPFVKALGLYLASEGRAQVSMNLTRFPAIPLGDLYAAIESRAEAQGARIHASELIGFVPRKAFDLAPEVYRGCRNFTEDKILEVRMAKAGLPVDGSRAESP